MSHISEFDKAKNEVFNGFRMCHHDTKEGFQDESDFTYLKKLYRDGLQKSGMAHLLLNKNCITCCSSLLPTHEGGDIN